MSCVAHPCFSIALAVHDQAVPDAVQFLAVLVLKLCLAGRNAGDVDPGAFSVVRFGNILMQNFSGVMRHVRRVRHDLQERAFEGEQVQEQEQEQEQVCRALRY